MTSAPIILEEDSKYYIFHFNLLLFHLLYLHQGEDEIWL